MTLSTRRLILLLTLAFLVTSTMLVVTQQASDSNDDGLQLLLHPNNQSHEHHHWEKSWASCQCRAHFGCFLLLGNCIVTVVDRVAVISPTYPAWSQQIAKVITQCKIREKVRLATDEEWVRLSEECSQRRETRGVGGSEGRNVTLAVMSRRDHEYHPYHNTIYPTGAFQHFSVGRAALRVLVQMGAVHPHRLVYRPMYSTSNERYTTPISMTKLLVYAMMPPGMAYPEMTEPSTTSSCSTYHAVGLWLPKGVKPDGMLQFSLPAVVKAEFVAFRDHIRNTSLLENGDSPLNPNGTVMHCPRDVQCDPNRIRHMTRQHIRDFSTLLLNITNGTEVVTDYLRGSIDDFRHHFHRIRSSTVLFGAEGAFFTWMLVARSESIWVMYYRAPPEDNPLGPPFHTRVVEALPDVKLVVYMVVNGVAPPLSELERAIRESFAPFVSKVVTVKENRFSRYSRDPIFDKCIDEEPNKTQRTVRWSRLNDLLPANIIEH